MAQIHFKILRRSLKNKMLLLFLSLKEDSPQVNLKEI